MSRVRALVVAASLTVLGLAIAAPGSSAAGSVASELAAASIRTVVAGTDGADTIRIAQMGDGSLSVLVNGLETIVPPASAVGAVVNARAGDDVVDCDVSVTTAIAVLGGAGNDRIVTGAGDDYVDAGAGRDVVGGAGGEDVLYGGPGVDLVDGGDGADYLDGGLGNDRVSGGGANDLLIGGRGADLLDGGDGDDLMAGGPGSDRYAGGAGLQRTFAQRDDLRPFLQAGSVTWVSLGGLNAAGAAIGSDLVHAGSGAFSQRFASDVEALLSLPMGRRLLLALDAGRGQVRVVSSDSGNRTTILDAAAAFLRTTGKRGPGSASRVAYDPMGTIIGDASESWMHRPPAVGLYHELVHALGAGTGSLQPGKSGGVRKLELQAIGIPFDGILWDHDRKASTRRQSGNQRAFTENGFRALLRLEARTRY